MYPPLTPRFAAAFFDLDGTLIDTGPPHRAAEEATLREFGFEGLADDHPDTFGHGVVPGSLMVAEHYGINDSEGLLEEYWRQWNRVIADGLDLLPGADAAVRAVAASGSKTALVTSGDRKYADDFLKMSGLGEVFSESVTLDDVENLKPNPEPYRKAAGLLGISPERCVVFEDSIAGFLAARSAGMTCVGVGKVALEADEDVAPDMAISSFVGFDIWNVRPH
jgi:HAD superfamily hydrolase (TIGR01509 family)